MNYIELINNFWAVSEEEDLTANDQITYFALLKYCNSLNWLNPFVCHWDILIQYSKTSKNTFYNSLNKLEEVKLIKYEKGIKNSRKKPKVFILDIKNKKGIIKEQKGNKEGIKEEQKGNLYKLLNKETIKLINTNYILVNDNLKNWIDSIDKQKNKRTKEQITIEDDRLNYIYNLYPSRCPFSNRNLGKGKKSKDKIKVKLKEYGLVDLEKRIQVYMKECNVNKTFYKDFNTLLNNIDTVITDEPKKKDDDRSHLNIAL